MCEQKLSDNKYILAGLRLYGDTLAECILDPAMQTKENAEGLEGFKMDSFEVERLIIKYQDEIQAIEEVMT